MSDQFSERAVTRNVAFSTELNDGTRERALDAAESAVSTIEASGIGVASYSTHNAHCGTLEVLLICVPRKEVEDSMVNDVVNRGARKIMQATVERGSP